MTLLDDKLVKDAEAILTWVAKTDAANRQEYKIIRRLLDAYKASVKPQEPVGELEVSLSGYTFWSNKDWPIGEYPLYAAPVQAVPDGMVMVSKKGIQHCIISLTNWAVDGRPVPSVAVMQWVDNLTSMIAAAPSPDRDPLASKCHDTAKAHAPTIQELEETYQWPDGVTPTD